MVRKFFVDEDGTAVSKKPKAQPVSTTPVAREFIPIAYATDTELASWAGLGYTMIFDIECFINYFLIGFKCIETGKYVTFEDSPGDAINLEKLQWLVFNFRLVGFNSRNYDIPMLFLALRGYKAETLKRYSNILIPEDKEDRRPVNYRKEFGLIIPEINHIDIQEVCPLNGSLKKYAARIHAKRLQDLPFNPYKTLTYDEAQFVKNYCLGSDIVATEQIFNELADQFKLRYDLSDKYQIDLRSKSDAQIAESVIFSEVKKKTGRTVKRKEVEPGTRFKYKPPEFLNYRTDAMKEKFQVIKDMDFEITEEGKLSMPDTLKEMTMRIGDTYYKLGKGGLHSKEKCASYKAENGMLLIDIDVESFYPRMILNSGLYPEAIGPIFLEIFEELVNRRIHAKTEAKRIKDAIKEINKQLKAVHPDLQISLDSYQTQADGLKITINGTFGKLGSRWSIMYAPDLLIQVTLTGQLSLLMLIERYEMAGLRCVSANTDGIVLYIHESQYEQLNAIKDQWCKEANFKMEETRYKALYSRDVNNYMALKLKFDSVKKAWTDVVEGVKLKGAYSNPWGDPSMGIWRFHKNPNTTICIEAIEKLLVDNIPVESSIRECRDITKFIFTRDVKGGAHKNGVFLGKTVRAYYAQDERHGINYIMNGNNVSDSEGAKPLMDLPDYFPEDIDYSAYVEKANSMLYDIGFYRRPETATLFD